MATSSALSTALTALAESIAPAFEGKPLPSAASLYCAIIRARDEAVCLEARASARDASVNRLLKQVEEACAAPFSLPPREAESGEGRGGGSSDTHAPGQTAANQSRSRTAERLVQ